MFDLCTIILRIVKYFTELVFTLSAFKHLNYYKSSNWGIHTDYNFTIQFISLFISITSYLYYFETT